MCHNNYIYVLLSNYLDNNSPTDAYKNATLRVLFSWNIYIYIYVFTEFRCDIIDRM